MWTAALAGFALGCAVASVLLARRRRDTSSATDQTDKRIIEISRLAGGLAHEIRNPLSTLMVNLRLLEEDLGEALAQDSDTLRRARLKIGVVRAESERLQRMLDEFLLLVSPVRLRLERVELNALADRLCEFYRPEARRHQITLRQSLHPEPLYCQVDADALQQAVLNLLVNAQQAIDGEGEILVTTTAEPGVVRLDVADTGEGMPPDVLEKAMQAFYSTKPNGSGLGLSTTARIVAAHGGTLGVQSTPGVGTCFEIRLPAADA